MEGSAPDSRPDGRVERSPQSDRHLPTVRADDARAEWHERVDDRAYANSIAQQLRDQNPELLGLLAALAPYGRVEKSDAAWEAVALVYRALNRAAARQQSETADGQPSPEITE